MELPERPSMAVYDEQDRDLIRRQLLSYMERHKIGVPTLQERIAGTVFRNDYSRDSVPFKSLQRFLAGRHRTNDALVWLCHKFTLTIDAEDPVREFGDSLCRFYGFVEDSNLRGHAVGNFGVEATVQTSRELMGGEVPISYAALAIEQVADRAFFRVTEIREDRSVSRKVAQRQGEKVHSFIAEGIGFHQNNAFVLLLRDPLTRLHTSYIFAAAPDEETASQTGVVTAPFFNGLNIDKADSLPIRISREEEAA